MQKKFSVDRSNIWGKKRETSKIQNLSWCWCAEISDHENETNRFFFHFCISTKFIDEFPLKCIDIGIKVEKKRNRAILSAKWTILSLIIQTEENISQRDDLQNFREEKSFSLSNDDEKVLFVFSSREKRQLMRSSMSEYSLFIIKNGTKEIIAIWRRKIPSILNWTERAMSHREREIISFHLRSLNNSFRLTDREKL